MIITRFTSGAALICLASATYSIAHAQGFYVDGGYSNISYEEPGVDLDVTVDMAAGHYGYSFSPYFSVEAEVLIGASKPSQTLMLPDENDVVSDARVELAINSIFGAYARGSYPIGDRISVFAGLGYVYGELESSIEFDQSTMSEKDSEAGIAYTAGAEVDLTDHVFVRGDYTRYDIEAVETDAFMIGGGYRF